MNINFFSGMPNDKPTKKSFCTRGSAHFVDSWHGDASYSFCEDDTPGSMVDYLKQSHPLCILNPYMGLSNTYYDIDRKTYHVGDQELKKSYPMMTYYHIIDDKFMIAFYVQMSPPAFTSHDMLMYDCEICLTTDHEIDHDGDIVILDYKPLAQKDIYQRIKKDLFDRHTTLGQLYQLFPTHYQEAIKKLFDELE